MAHRLMQGDEENQLGVTPGFDRSLYLDKLVEAGKSDLLYGDTKGHTVLNLATLQRMIIFQLQTKILEKVVPLITGRFENKNPLEDVKLRDAMVDYAQAIRDWELMADYEMKANGDEAKDPFCISSKWDLVSKVMENAHLKAGGDRYGVNTLHQLMGTFNERTRVNKDRNLKELTARLAAAVLGGIALIGPMLLMVLRQDKTTNLITTCVAVLVFAIMMAQYSTGSKETIVATVAAYAAVLVVFVGSQE